MKTIEEKNKMIAAFMGGYEPEEYEEFHTSWDLLMPVAHKCMQSTDDLHPYAEADVVNKITRGLSSFQIHFAYDEVVSVIEFLQFKTDSHD